MLCSKDQSNDEPDALELDNFLHRLNFNRSIRKAFTEKRAWLTWWVRTSQSWHYQTVLSQFIYYCRDSYIAKIAMALLLTKDRETGTPVGLVAGLDLTAIARGL